MGKRYIFDLMEELHGNSAKTHQKLISEYEEKYKRTLICYNTLFGHPAGSISDVDGDLLHNIIRSIDIKNYRRRLDFIIHSPGGSPEAAEKIIQTIRAYFGDFRVIVPNSAMSAATLVCMGADEIIMSSTSRLGPIDPQMIFKNKEGALVMRPAKVIIDAYRDVVSGATQAIGSGAPAQPYLRLIDNQDVSWVIECMKARQATSLLANKFLKDKMLSSLPDADIAKTVKFFLDIGDNFTHGKTINSDEATMAGLKIKKISLESKQWDMIWDIYNRIERHTSEKGLAKYLVCREGGIEVQVKNFQ